MNPLPSRATCPVDLDFPEPEPARLDLASIVARGRRLRQRRRLTAAGSAIAACAAVASIVAGAQGGTFRWLPAAAPAPSAPVTPVDALAAAHPPVNGKLTLLSERPAHWTTVAWATRQGNVCWATYRTPMQGATEDGDCPGWSGTDIPAAGRPGLSPLLPGVLPPAPGASRLVPEVGLVTPRAVRVTVRFYGREFSAGVAPVPLGRGKTIGVYLVWLRLPPGTSSYGSADTGPAVAYDAAGRVVARHGPGI